MSFYFDYVTIIILLSIEITVICGGGEKIIFMLSLVEKPKIRLSITGNMQLKADK